METSQARKWRWLIFAATSLETLLFGGIVFGWGSLVYVLKHDGIFFHLCAKNSRNVSSVLGNTSTHEPRPNQLHIYFADQTNLVGDHRNNVTTNYSTGQTAQTSPTDDVSGEATSADWMTCEAQDNMLSLCFSVSAAILYTTTSIAGALTYKLGTRFTRLIGWCSFTAGGLLTAFTSPGNPWLLFVGLPTLGFGGVVLLITNIQVGTLFEKGSSTVIAAMTGFYDTSSVIMLFIKFAHESGFSRRDSLLALCGLHVLTLLNTLLLMPRTHFTWNGDGAQEQDHNQVPDVGGTSELLNEVGQEQKASHTAENLGDHNAERNTTEKRRKPTLKECLLSTMFILEMAWIALLQLRFSFFLNSLNPWLEHRLTSKQQVSHFTNVSLYSMMAGLLISLISGATFDFFKHVFAKQVVLERRRLYPSVTMLCITSSLGVLLSLTVLIPTADSIYASFVFAALLRSFLYSVDANVVTLIFPPEYFGALFGVSDFVGGAVSMLQYALVVWHQTAGFTMVNYAMLAVAAATFLHPAVQLCRGLRIGRPKDAESYTTRSANATDEETVAL